MFPSLRIAGQDNAMKYFYLIFFTLFSLTPTTTDAAKILFHEKTEVSSGLVQLEVLLDPEEESVNAFAGTLSIPSNYFVVDAVSTAGSIVSLWLDQPHVSTELNMTTRIRIPFEGILPGGFTGVRSPYYVGTRPATLFTVTLRPRSAGEAIILLENVDIRRNDGNATKIPSETTALSIVIPELSTLPKITKMKNTPYELPSSTVRAFLTHDISIQNGKWALVVHDEEKSRTLKSYYVAEARASQPNSIRIYEWKKATFPYVLSNQSRNRFIHIKAEYTDGAYSFTTIAPVEKADDMRDVWRILSSIVVVILIGYFLMKHYAKKQ
jgi:hypothetical protein